MQTQAMPTYTSAMTASRPYILEASNVNVRYQDTDALRDVSLQFLRGERLAVVGPNGAGKSTLFKVISGVLTPTRGRVATYPAPGGNKVAVAYVPQRNEVDWSFPVSVAEVVLMGRTGRIGLFRRPGARDREAVRRALESVDMTVLAHRQIGALSGGQQQRVFIARALAQEADLMLLDEPLTGLDVGSQDELFGLMDRLQRSGVTLVVSTHDLNQAAEKFDRVLLLNRRVVGLGTPDEVLTAEKLQQAYGGRMRMIPAENGQLLLGDSHCEGCER